MRAVVIYRESSEYARDVETLIRDVERRTGKTLETIDPDRKENEIFLEAHDVVEYPTVMGLDDSGRVLAEWRGRLPRVDEVAYYARERGM